MGRASTFFNTMRQVGSAIGVAILSTVLITVGSVHREPAAARTHRPTSPAYHMAFLVAALFALAAIGFSLTIHDVDAAETIVPRVRSARRRARAGVPLPEGSTA